MRRAGAPRGTANRLMEPIRVLHVLDKLTVGESQLHGVTRLCSWWIPAHDPSRFQVAAASLRGRDAAGEYLEGLGIGMHYLGRSAFDPRVLTDLLRLVEREGIDLLHLHGYGASNFGRLCAWLRGLPCIVHEHICDAGIPGYQRLADRLLSRRTTRAIAISRSVREFMVRRRAIPEDRIEVLYNGIPLDAYAGGAPGPGDAGAWRRACGIPDPDPVVSIVGRLSEIKGHRYFLEAARRVLARRPDTSFVVVGDGELLPELRERADALGIAARVFFLGHRHDVPDILRGSDVAVIASLSEGGPLVLFEAMAARCAAIITETCGLAELIEDGRNGFVVPARDADAIADRVLRLLDDPALRASLAVRGRADALGHDVRHSVGRLEGIYRRLLSAGGPGPRAPGVAAERGARSR